jgi:hypothetical protein
MKTKSYLLYLFLVLLPILSARAHNETMATIFIFQVGNTVYVEASLEKRCLVYALQQEGGCSPENMMKVCGDKYVRENIIVSINGKEVVLEKVAMYSTRDFITIHYKVSNMNTLASIGVKSSYMLKYNNHSRVKAVFDFNNNVSTYFLHESRKEILAKF